MLIWAPNARDRRGLYGTIHRLSMHWVTPRTFSSNLRPPSSGDRRRYNGYPSPSDWVSLMNSFGNRLLQSPLVLSMQGLSGLINPHGPCIIVVLTISNSSGSEFASGISALMRLSIWSDVTFWTSQKSECACGKPRFCHSTVYTKARTDPKILCLSIRSSIFFSFSWKTRATMSGLSFAVWNSNRFSVISSHFGLQVKVINKSGRPNSLTYAMASCARSCMYLGLPVCVDGKMHLFPNSLASLSADNASLKWE